MEIAGSMSCVRQVWYGLRKVSQGCLAVGGVDGMTVLDNVSVGGLDEE